VEILAALAAEPEGNEFTVTFNGDPAAFPVRPGGALTFRVLEPPGWAARLRYEPWLQLVYPRSIPRSRDARPAVGLFLDAKAPLAWRGIRVVRVQDLAFHYFPKSFTLRDRLRLRGEAFASVRAADRVVAISESTKRDLVALYGTDPARVSVAPNGVAARFRPLPPDHAAVTTVRARHALARPYVLTVGVLQKRKNVLRLLQAWELMRRRVDPGCDLVHAGRLGWMYEEVLAYHARMPLRDEVRFLGPLEDEELLGAYAGATAFVLPSLYEGFGIPLAEAMACGAPCAAAGTSSLPEVGGDAALYFAPESVEEMAAVLERLLGDAALRRDLAARGPAQAAKFTWAATARALNVALREASRA
jgi:glycosyltransferase involved in cell wall biosynthesis